MGLEIENELRKIWDRIPTEPNVVNKQFDINSCKALLDLFHVGKYYYMVLNVRTSTYEFVSPEVEEVLGYPAGELDFFTFLNLLHPVDKANLLNYETATEKFFQSVPPEKLFKYKVQYDFRLRRADGHYVRILNQMNIIQHDNQNVRTFLVNTDISHLKHDDTPRMSIIGLDGEPSYYNIDFENIFKPTQQVFTRREKDILKAMASGLKSQEISDALHISKLTVDSHRKNILRKTNARSASEVIRIAYDNGWI
ncbi:LuxR C-terminal-related transcriptional regulator [Flavobacterium akiainvivens]|uniref:LuxR C-terminal-related transcriptional regulator n=1 Tax=Flavobacterium akiainvivens TaxID=1202724 RepID=UPI0008F12AF4|nr:LuxR C-terminal-related transcriptional regulator [Flavobacterium akiainvivens]SFQ50749.1 PAS fold-containing protein [Flavobacterium akiainvivens]